jgi:rhodanese-related sulfurtransferase
VVARIDASELRRRIEQGVQLVEVLPDAEYRDEHLPGAINVPLKALDRCSTTQLDKRRAIVVSCWDAL